MFWETLGIAPKHDSYLAPIVYSLFFSFFCRDLNKFYIKNMMLIISTLILQNTTFESWTVEFFSKYSIDADAHNMHVRSSLRTYTLNPTNMSIFKRLSRQILENDEVTTGTSLSRGTSPTTENTTSVKFWNKSRKCEHQHRVKDSNRDKQVPPQETLSAERSIELTLSSHWMLELGWTGFTVRNLGKRITLVDKLNMKSYLKHVKVSWFMRVEFIYAKNLKFCVGKLNYL